MKRLSFLATALLASLLAHAETVPTFSGATVTPPSLAFPFVYLTQESPVQTVTFKNTYLGAEWTITAVTSSDPQYVVTGETCTAKPVLRNGGTCAVSVKYVPTAIASTSAAKVTLTRTSAGGNMWFLVGGSADTIPQVPSLPTPTAYSGVSQLPGPGLAFSELLLGNVSAEKVLTFKNAYLGADWTVTAVASSDPTQFEVTAETCTAKPVLRNGGTCSVNVRFKPAKVGLQNAAVNVTRTSAGGNFKANLAGIGRDPASIPVSYNGASLAPRALTFSPTAMGTTSAEQTVTVQNTYAATSWSVTAVTTDNPAFKIISNPCTNLTPGASCALKVAFAPAALQEYSGNLLLTRLVGTVSSPMAIKLSGSGIAPATSPLVASPAALAFDAQATGKPQVKTVSVTNTGATAVTLQPPTVSAGDFSLTSHTCGSTVAAGASCTVTVTFTPGAVGVRTANLILTPNGSIARVISLSGTGVNATAAVLRADPGLLIAAPTAVGANSAPLALALSNTGSAPLTITSVLSSSAQFAISHNCVLPLSGGNACQALLTFKPTAAGLQTGTLTITHNGTPSPALVQLAGEGLGTFQGWTEPTRVDFANQVVGMASEARVLTFYNDATTPIALLAPSLQGDTGAFTLTTTCGLTLAAKSACTATVAFAPKAGGYAHATVLLTGSADQLLKQAVELTGTGTAAP